MGERVAFIKFKYQLIKKSKVVDTLDLICHCNITY